LKRDENWRLWITTIFLDLFPHFRRLNSMESKTHPPEIDGHHDAMQFVSPATWEKHDMKIMEVL
jgi:hypothetical protein